MAKEATKTRYLLICNNEKNLKKLTGNIGSIKDVPTLTSSSGIKKPPQNNLAIINEKIRVVTVPLTPKQKDAVSKMKLCKIELDHYAYSCVEKAETLEAAISEHPYPWGIKKIDADIVWSKTKGRGVKVGVLDTGVYPDHPDLKKNIKKGVSFVENVSSSNDDNGHGTHCAGILAAHGEKIFGVAPEASIYPVKVLNFNGKGLFSGIISGMEWCLQNKIDIVSMSFQFQSNKNPSKALEQACNRLWEEGLVLVGAVGNDREDRNANTSNIGYPARYNNVLGVGATNSYDTIAPFSNIGRGLDLVAPGVDILSAYRDRYRKLSGTSQACPHVAGLAALLKSYRKNLTNEDIKKVILETADPLGSDEPDEVYGHGLLNASAAIEQLDSIID